MTFITELLNQFGYSVLYLSLALELLGIPLFGETLMTYCGFLVFQGTLNFIASIIFSTSGIITGITIAYFVGGKFGEVFFRKYGARVHMGPEKLEKVSNWFGKYGKKLLVVAYFIPGVIHVIGYVSGIIKIPYRKFALNAYIGALIWATTFISLGKILGSNWHKFHSHITKYLIIGSIILVLILLCVYFIKNHKQQIINTTNQSLDYAFKIFHSLGKVRIVVMSAAIVFIGLVTLVVGLIQDLFAHEFGKFDFIIHYIIKQIFKDNWSVIFSKISFLTTYPMIIVITIVLIVWVMIKGKNKVLEIKFLLLTLWGGEVLEEILRYAFHRIGPVMGAINREKIYTFPSEQSLMAIIIYGFTAFIIIRYINNRLISNIAIFITLAICILSGLSPLFYQYQYPSDVVAGYVFGGVWLSLNIVLMEVFRILPNINNKKVSS